eukprot:GHRR01001356.1.p1 GENE.GHRR01001356.1~~GHRR01001356.1.p1  ORF type:complete len:241 (+),score=74.34 GHRR01001356.1:206-928(+)
MPVNVVFGAGGPTGQECVKRLLKSTQLPVRAVVRDPSKYADTFKQEAGAESRLELVTGDVTDPASLTAAVSDAQGIIFAASGKGYWSAEGVDNKGVGNVASAAKSGGTVQRVVLVSSMLTHPSNRLNPIRILLNNIRWSLMDHKYQGEEKLKASGISYTIVRPGGLTNKPAGQVTLNADVNMTKEGGHAGSISRGDVAAVCVEALTNPAAANKTLSIYSGKALEAEQTLDGELKRLFSTI